MSTRSTHGVSVPHVSGSVDPRPPQALFPGRPPHSGPRQTESSGHTAGVLSVVTEGPSVRDVQSRLDGPDVGPSHILESSERVGQFGCPVLRLDLTARRIVVSMISRVPNLIKDYVSSTSSLCPRGTSGFYIPLYVSHQYLQTLDTQTDHGDASLRTYQTV